MKLLVSCRMAMPTMGVVHLKNSSLAKPWYRSHHRDGTTYMKVRSASSFSFPITSDISWTPPSKSEKSCSQKGEPSFGSFSSLSPLPWHRRHANCGGVNDSGLFSLSCCRHVCTPASSITKFAFAKTISRTATAASTAAPPTKHYDVLIVGGGVVGATLARRLVDVYRETPTTASSSSVNVDGASAAIGLVETRAYPKPLSFHETQRDEQVPPSPRAYALSPSSLHFIGLDSVVEKLNTMKRVGYYNQMQVWESDGPATLRFTSSDLQDSASTIPDYIVNQNILGGVIEDEPLVSAIWEELRHAEQQREVDLICESSVKSIHAPPTSTASTTTTTMGLPPKPVTITLERTVQDRIIREDVTTNLLIAADGANSFVRRSLGMSTVGFGYGRRALTCTVEVSRTMNSTAYQRFMPPGPLALLPIWKEGQEEEKNDKYYASIVWSTTPSHCDQLQSLSTNDFLQELNDVLQRGPTNNPSLVSEETQAKLPNAVSNILYGIEMLARAANEGLTMMQWNENHPFLMPPVVTRVLGRRFAFDLNLNQAQSYVRPRVALVGDAAHVVHPLAGQGLNLGLADAKCLVRQIDEAQKSGMDVGETMLFLNRYDVERRREVSVTMGTVHALHSLFGLEHFVPGIYARSLGMNLVNSAGPIRKKLAAVAVGAGGVFSAE